MNRRDSVLALAALGATPLISRAQRPPKIPRIGFLSLAANNTLPTAEAFRRGLRELGYVEGQNLVVEWRFADNQFERLPGLATELVRLKVDVIVTAGTPAIAAAQKATSTIPIVMASSADPVGSGFVKSLSRPGTNITGLTIISVDIGAKELELLVTMVPKLSRVAYLINPVNQVSGALLSGNQKTAQGIGITMLPIEARSAQEIESAFGTMKKQSVGAGIVAADSLFITQRELVASLATKQRLPSIAAFPEYVEVGGLMSFGVNRPDLWRHASVYVDKILRGAKPGDLPVEQPTRFELAVNTKTANALGLVLPRSIQLRADRLIE